MKVTWEKSFTVHWILSWFRENFRGFALDNYKNNFLKYIETQNDTYKIGGENFHNLEKMCENCKNFLLLSFYSLKNFVTFSYI